MTQLVELQQVVNELRTSGYEPFAISNDPVQRLRDFSDKYGITYPLLSDEDSGVIRRFGILNTLIRPDEGRSMRWYGIPYPGTYFVDHSGIIVDKDFHQHHARRASGRSLLHRALGTVPPLAPGKCNSSATTSEVELQVYLADEALKLEVISTLVCRVTVCEGRHIYAPGAPEGFTPARIAVTGPGIRAGDPIWPDARQLAMPLLKLTAPVFEDAFAVVVPLTATSDVIRLGHGLESTHVAVRVDCDFQSCDEDSCSLPQRVGVDVRLPLATLVEPEGIQVYVERVRGSTGSIERG